MSTFANVQNWARKQAAPVTLSIGATLIVLSLFFWFANGRMLDVLAFGSDWIQRPWSILTYPFAFVGVGGINQLIMFMLLLAWMNMSCASIERDLGTQNYIGFWVAMTVIPAICMWIGMIIVGRGTVLSGPYMPITGISIAWCIRNRTMMMNLFGILPLSGTWMAAIIVLGTLFVYGSGAPLMGLFAIVHQGLSYLYADNKLPFLAYVRQSGYRAKPSKEKIARDNAYTSEVLRRAKEREERERLRKLFEGSLNEDDKR